MSLFKLLHIDIKRIINFLFIIALITLPTYLAVIGKEVAASLSLISISFALVFWNLDKFSKFKGAGFEAELKSAVEETYAAIDEVKKLAVCISSPTVSLLAVSGAFQYLPLKYKLEYAAKIASTLSELKIDKDEIDEALSSLYSRVENDHHRKILVALNQKLDSDCKLFEKIDEINFSDWPVARLRQKASELNVDIDDALHDYEYFVSNKKLRNPDSWQG